MTLTVSLLSGDLVAQLTAQIPTTRELLHEERGSLPRLFLTTAFIMVNACFADLIPSDLLERMRESMNIAVLGDENRVPGEGSFEDNLRPCYTNVSIPYLRVLKSSHGSCASCVVPIPGTCGKTWKWSSVLK